MLALSLFVVMLSTLLLTSHGFRMMTKHTPSRGLAMALKKKEAPANPIALVTGAGRGIGKAISLALADAGCKIIVNYASNEAQAQEVVEELKAIAGPKGGTAVAIKADISNAEEVQAMFAQAVEEVSAPTPCLNVPRFNTSASFSNRPFLPAVFTAGAHRHPRE
jgi:shikimate 5-dehydrogenase